MLKSPKFGLRNLGKTSLNKNGRSLVLTYGQIGESSVLILTESDHNNNENALRGGDLDLLGN